MPQDRGRLGKIADRVRMESQLPIYPVQGGIPADDKIFWDGKDVGEFLALAKQIGAKAVYLDESVVEEGEADPDYASHIGETSSIQVSFLLDGRFHTFFESAEWIPEETPEGEAAEGAEETGQQLEIHRLYPSGLSPEIAKRDLRKVDEVLTSRRDEIIDSYLHHLLTRDDPPPDPDYEWDVRRDLFVYLGDLLGISELKTGATYFELNRDVEGGKALKSVVPEIIRKLRASERAIVDGAVMGCEEWVGRRGIPLRSLNVERVREYADETGLKISRSGLRELRDRVGAVVKRKRVGGSHHA